MRTIRFRRPGFDLTNSDEEIECEFEFEIKIEARPDHKK